MTTGVLYLWDLSASGWANSFYAAAVQAGSVSWKAFLFGASDAAASITVDKPPASLWIMALSVRIFGLNSWAMLVPQALMGVATVGIVYSSVRRYFSAQAGLIAGAVLALTPVAALMFRYNNPDALLVLLLTLAVALTIRGVEDGRTRWLVIAGALIGFAFLTKQLQAVLVLPGIAVVYLVAAPISIWHRIRDSLLALVAMVVTAGWWVAIVELTPAADRPYVGGSTNNSFFDLTFGYNGLGRIFGRSAGTATVRWYRRRCSPRCCGHRRCSSRHRACRRRGRERGCRRQRCRRWRTGRRRRWRVRLERRRLADVQRRPRRARLVVIPAALLLGLFGLWILGRKVRTDVRRAALLLWGATLVVSGLTFSLMDGTFHQYYTVALAPSIGAVVGIGAWLLWTRRTETWALPLLAAVSLVTTGWAFIVLARSPEWNPWLRWVVLVVGLLAVAGLLLGRRFGPAVLRTGVVLALVAAFAGPTSWTVQTVLTPHTGGAVTTGPAVEGSASGARGGAAAGAGALPGGAGGPAAGQARGGQGAAGELPGGEALGGQDAAGQAAAGAQGAGANGRGSTTVSDTIVEMLLTDADSYTWVAATTDAQSAASYQLPTEKSVMPIGGFNGGDPSPTLEQFQAYVADGEIHYYIANGSGAGAGLGGGRASEEGTTTIATWVSETYTAETVDGVTIYDLTVPIG